MTTKKRNNVTTTVQDPSSPLSNNEEDSNEDIPSYNGLITIEADKSPSTLIIWTRRVQTLGRVLFSKALLPDNIKDHYLTVPLIGIILIILIFFPIRLYFFLFILGAIASYVYFSPSMPKEDFAMEGALQNWLLAPMQFEDKNEKLSPSSLLISPIIDEELGIFLDDLIREIINSWYVPLCKSSLTEFQSCVRSTMNAAIMNLLKFGSTRNKDTVTLILNGVTNAFRVHMEEFRAFEASKLPLDKFIASAVCRRRYHKGYLEELEHLRQLTGLLLKKLLPKQESRSILLNSLLREIISGNALVGLIGRLSDPDFINEMIIKFMRDPKDSIPSLESGWNILVIKVLRGKNLSTGGASSGGLYLVIYVGGRRVKTKRIRDKKDIWNETFKFKLPDSVRQNLKVYVQLCQFSYVGQDSSLGYAKFIPNFSDSFKSNPIWLKFPQKPKGIDQPVNRASAPPEILLEVTTSIGGHKSIENQTNIPKGTVPSGFACDFNLQTTSVRDTSQIPQRPPLNTEQPLPYNSNQDLLDHGMIPLEAALQNNELFVEFLEYLSSVNAPPYLQFLMNVDALRQFVAMSLGIDKKSPTAVEAYFRKGPLTTHQTEQLKMIKHDSADIFSTHFTDTARYRIPLDPGMRQELQEWVIRSDKVDENNLYVGGPVGPALFVPAYKWVASILERDYFPKFKMSEAFARFLDRAQFSTLNFTVDDDMMSVYSNDGTASSSLNVTIGTGIEHSNDHDRENIHSLSTRSRTNSYDTLDDFKENLEDNTTDLKKLATEISITRQKISLIDEQIEKHQNETSSEATLYSLHKERANLEAHVKNLLELVESKASDVPVDNVWMDLTNAAVRVQSANLKEEDGTVLGSIWSSTMGPVMNAVSDPIFDIAVINEDEIDSSLVTRPYSEFCNLHRLLKRQFPKVGKIPFPEQGLLGNEGLDQSLQSYLELLMSDEFVRQSNILREFVTLEGNYGSETSAAGQFVEAIVGKKVKNALKSATSVLSGANSVDERRNKFYEARDRHTTADIRSNTEITSSPNFYSVSDIATLERTNSSTLLISGEDPVQFPSLPPRPERKANPGKVDNCPEIHVIEELNEMEVEMIVETFYAFVIETFDLREPNQWLRRKFLGAFKQFLKQAYGDTLGKMLTDFINGSFKYEAILKYLNEARQALWPEGEFIGKRPPPVPRSEDQKFATMIEARTIFLERTPVFIQNIAGRYNAICGMTRIFNALQHQQLNKTLIYAVLDIVLKLFFSDQST